MLRSVAKERNVIYLCLALSLSVSSIFLSICSRISLGSATALVFLSVKGAVVGWNLLGVSGESTVKTPPSH